LRFIFVFFDKKTACNLNSTGQTLMYFYMATCLGSVSGTTVDVADLEL